MDSDIVSRLKEFMEYNSLNSLTLSRILGYKSSEKVSRLFRDEENKAKPSYDIIYDISTKFEISINWLITGRGSMLHDNKASEENTMGATSNVAPIFPAEESFIYKMYEKKDAENKALIEEIGGLKERIRQLESQDKETDRHTKISEALESFTSESYGDYGEDSLPTKQPTTSKRLSDGKI